MADEGSILNSLNLGRSKDVLKGDGSNPLGELLTVLMQDVIDQLRTSVDKYDISASGNLKQSLKPTKVEVNGDEVSIGVEADFYWKYINYGVNGTNVNHGAPSWGSAPSSKSFEASIDEWIRNRGITLPSSFSSYESFNYVIRRSIKEKGKKPRPFFSDVINQELTKELKAPIEKLLGRAITIVIKEGWQ